MLGSLPDVQFFVFDEENGAIVHAMTQRLVFPRKNGSNFHMSNSHHINPPQI